jgi:hypothetical protein
MALIKIAHRYITAISLSLCFAFSYKVCKPSTLKNCIYKTKQTKNKNCIAKIFIYIALAHSAPRSEIYRGLNKSAMRKKTKKKEIHHQKTFSFL